MNSTAIRVSWKLPISNKQHGQIRGYQVTYVKLENNEPRGQPVIKDVMLSEAQVWHGDRRLVGMAPSLSAGGLGWLGPSISRLPLAALQHGTQPCLSRVNSLSTDHGLQTGKKFYQEKAAVGKMMYRVMLLSSSSSHVYLSPPASSCADSSWSNLCFAGQVITLWRAVNKPRVCCFRAADCVQSKARLWAEPVGCCLSMGRVG